MMKHALPLIAMFALAACDVQPQAEVSKQSREELAKLDGPDVAGVVESLERNALEALTSGNYPRAAGLYKQLVDQEPTESRFKLGLAESLRRVGEFRVAVELYDLVIDEFPGHVDAHEGKALALMALGDTRDASRIFEKVLEREPDRWRTHNALGILFTVKQLPNEATAYFKKALEHSPKNPSVLNNLALLEAIQRRYRQAVKQFEAAARQAEGRQREQIEMNLALVHGVNGNMAEARAVASRHLKGALLENNMGLYALLSDNRELAKSYLNMALTGSSVYYKRAWQNLDIIAKQGKDNRPKKGKSFRIE